jgi:hypothetical protein
VQSLEFKPHCCPKEKEVGVILNTNEFPGHLMSDGLNMFFSLPGVNLRCKFAYGEKLYFEWEKLLNSRVIICGNQCGLSFLKWPFTFSLDDLL